METLLPKLINFPDRSPEASDPKPITSHYCPPTPSCETQTDTIEFPEVCEGACVSNTTRCRILGGWINDKHTCVKAGTSCCQCKVVNFPNLE